MEKKLKIFNTISKKKEDFAPINPPYVGIYLCGPTVYGYAHIGHARSAIAVDLLIRTLNKLKYKVRYVRNITDVGHLERDSDDGNDKILKQATIESLEPMEIVNRYTSSYREDMLALNNIPPSIEPTASGHIVEQIDYIQKIIKEGYAYEKNGSIYFNVKKYSENFNYGQLSGRVLDELLENTRTLNCQSEKNFAADFALWKKAEEKHIMAWSSPWGRGYPGWHLECSAMSQKYLGEKFDIHAGGMDLIFPHHDCQIAQNEAVHKHKSVKYWFHNNMVTINNTKMAKSLDNFITLRQLFSGKNDILEKPFSPMVLRFFVLQAHYRSTLAFSNEALQAASVGYKKIMNGMRTLDYINNTSQKENFSKKKTETSQKILALIEDAKNALLDDLNSAKTIANLFEILKIINSLKADISKINEITIEAFNKLVKSYNEIIKDILGLKNESPIEKNKTIIDYLISKYILNKKEKNFAQVDEIRALLKKENIAINDLQNGVELVDI